MPVNEFITEQPIESIPNITEDASCLADDRYVDQSFRNLFVSVESDSTPPPASAGSGLRNPPACPETDQSFWNASADIYYQLNL